MQGDRMVEKIEGRWTFEHRVIAAKKIGRPLVTGEVVHHINGNKGDNRPKNLLVTTKSEHKKIHYEAEKIGLKVMAGELEVVSFWDVNIEGMAC